MTGYTVHTGSTVQFSDGWDRIFGGKPKAGSTSKKKKATKGKKTAKKSATAKETAGKELSGRSNLFDHRLSPARRQTCRTN